MAIHPFSILFDCSENEKPVQFVIENRHRSEHKEVEKSIDTAWTAYRKVHDTLEEPYLERELSRFIFFRKTENDFVIHIGKTTFRDFIGTNITHPWMVSQYGEDFMANPLRLGILVQCADGPFVLGLRYEKLDRAPGKADIFGGLLNFPKDDHPSMGRAILHNLDRYLGVADHEVSESRISGLVRNRLTLQPELIVEVTLTLTEAALAERFHHLESRSKYASLTFVQQDADIFFEVYHSEKQNYSLSARAGLWFAAKRLGVWDSASHPFRLPFLKKRPPRTALVLGGGFAKGGAHIGVIKVLEAMDFPIDLIVGNSIGGIMGAFYAARGSSDWLEQVTRDFNFKSISDWEIPTTALIKGRKLDAFLNQMLVYKSFDELTVPLAVVATDLVSGDEVVLCGKNIAQQKKKTLDKDPVPINHQLKYMVAPLASSVRATSAVPGIFSPVQINARQLADGLILDNVPVRVARQLGAEFIVAVDLSNEDPGGPYSNIYQIIMRGLNIQGSGLLPLQLYGADVVVRPDLRGLNFRDFSQMSKIIEAGEKAAVQKSEVLKEAFEKKGRLRLSI
jgi:NTE family protein